METQGKTQNILHQYCEVGGELLAKPNALCDILETQALPPTIVFCNNPSDADFVEVLLKKRGIGALKLIGYVPSAKLSKAMEKIAAKEISTLVVTDIAARGIKLSDFTLVANYSLPSDPEIYLQRVGMTQTPPESEAPAAVDGALSSLPATERRALSIVSPLDIANFHYLKKFLGIEFSKVEPPGKEELLKAKAENLRRQALNRFPTFDEQIRLFASIVANNPDREAIMGLLLYNTLEVIPQLNSSLEKASFERDFPPEGSEHGNRRLDDNRRGRGRARERGGRHERDRRRHADRERHDERSGLYGNEDDDSARREPDAAYGERLHEQQGNNFNTVSETRGDEPLHLEKDPPRVREDRLYIGHGALSGFSEDKFRTILETHCGAPKEALKRFALRKHYSFADIPEELTLQVLDKLGNLQTEDGERFFIRKAITISVPRETRIDNEENPQPAANETGPEAKSAEEESF